MKKWDDNQHNSKFDEVTNLGKESFHKHLMDFIIKNPKMKDMLDRNSIYGGSARKFVTFLKVNETDDLIQNYLIDIIQNLAIWINPVFYSEMPILFPYSVRERTTSADRNRGIEDNWGAANNKGFVIDDNSLIKDFIRNFPTKKSSYYKKENPRKGFVACHIWNDTTTNHWFFSFIPNLCWLPAPIARLSDVQNSFFSKCLKFVSYNLYRKLEMKSKKMNVIVNKVWNNLIQNEPITDLSECTIEYRKLCTSQQLLKRKKELILNIKEIIYFIDSQKTTPIRGVDKKKLLHKRYKPSLSSLIKTNPNAINEYRKWLEEYLEALEDNFSISSQSELVLK